MGWSRAHGKARRVILPYLRNVTDKNYIVGYREGWPSLTSLSMGAEDGRVSAV